MPCKKKYADANRGKADFSDVYDAPDPRRYFAALQTVRYQIPQNAKPWFQRLIGELRRLRGTKCLSILDVGCSYGVNSALLKHDLDLADLSRHYGRRTAAGLTPDALMRQDQRYFAEKSRVDGIQVIGLDVAEHAIDYARDVGLLDVGVSMDLEESGGTDYALAALARCDIIVSTGCVGYVTERTFRRLMEARDRAQPLPWVICLVLRMFPYTDIAATLAEFGLATVRHTGRTFVQRRFQDRHEQSHVISQIENLGRTVRGLEDQGWLHSELFLSLPSQELHEARLGFPYCPL